MRYVNVVDAWGACGARERCLGLWYRGMRRNTYSRTSREVEALMGQLIATCTPHPRRTAGRTPPFYRTGSHILPPLHITSNPPSHTRTLQVSGRTSLELWCISQGRCDTRRIRTTQGMPKRKPSTDQPSHVPLHTRTLRGAALSS